MRYHAWRIFLFNLINKSFSYALVPSSNRRVSYSLHPSNTRRPFLDSGASRNCTWCPPTSVSAFSSSRSLTFLRQSSSSLSNEPDDSNTDGPLQHLSPAGTLLYGVGLGVLLLASMLSDKARLDAEPAVAQIIGILQEDLDRYEWEIVENELYNVDWQSIRDETRVAFSNQLLSSTGARPSSSTSATWMDTSLMFFAKSVADAVGRKSSHSGLTTSRQEDSDEMDRSAVAGTYLEGLSRHHPTNQQLPTTYAYLPDKENFQRGPALSYVSELEEGVPSEVRLLVKRWNRLVTRNGGESVKTPSLLPIEEERISDRVMNVFGRWNDVMEKVAADRETREALFDARNRLVAESGTLSRWGELEVQKSLEHTGEFWEPPPSVSPDTEHQSINIADDIPRDQPEYDHQDPVWQDGEFVESEGSGAVAPCSLVDFDALRERGDGTAATISSEPPIIQPSYLEKLSGSRIRHKPWPYRPSRPFGSQEWKNGANARATTTHKQSSVQASERVHQPPRRSDKDKVGASEPTRISYLESLRVGVQRKRDPWPYRAGKPFPTVYRANHVH